MKTVFTIVAMLVAVSAQAELRHPDQLYTVLTCRQLGIWDAGTLVSIQSGGFAGITLARVSEQSIMGPRPVGTVAVRRLPLFSSEPATYVGTSFRLTVDQSQVLDNGMYRSYLDANFDGHAYNNKEIACTFVAHTM